MYFFFNDPATTEIYTLSLHGALPISETAGSEPAPSPVEDPAEVVEDTLDRYYDLLPDDPDAAYDLTGPYLRSVADRGYFRDFWEPWEKVELQDVRNVQQPEDGVITATTEVDLTGEDGEIGRAHV